MNFETDVMPNVPTSAPVLYRTYSRRKPRPDGSFIRETFSDILARSVTGLTMLGDLAIDEANLIHYCHEKGIAFPSGRWLWVGGTKWLDKPENYHGVFNCSSTLMTDLRAFALQMNLGMMGCGIGSMVEPQFIEQLPPVQYKIRLIIQGKPGDLPPNKRTDQTQVISTMGGSVINIFVGDSRQGWVDAYEALIKLATGDYKDYSHFQREDIPLYVVVHLNHVRGHGEPIKGFGGVTNPVKLEHMFKRVAEILNGAHGRQLNAVEVALLVDEAAACYVAGNVRRSAGMIQGASTDETFTVAKDNLWQQDDAGNWRIDPARDALRMANHTRVYHHKPTREECIEAVRKQFYSGEGAIQYAPEAIARANVDLFVKDGDRETFLDLYEQGAVTGDLTKARVFLGDLFAAQLLRQGITLDLHEFNRQLDHRMQRYGLNPCLAPGTKILTQEGDIAIENLVGRYATIWDGKAWTPVQFHLTGVDQPIYRLKTTLGDEALCTAYHKWPLWDGTWKPTKELQRGDLLLTMDEADMNYEQVAIVEEAGVATAVYCCQVPTTGMFALSNGLMTGNCGEIIGRDFMCNLAEVHLNRLDPLDMVDQKNAFMAGALTVAALLKRGFVEERFQWSREIDPIVGVSFTGLFDFFVAAFGADWLHWWEAGRPDDWHGITDAGRDQINRVVDALVADAGIDRDVFLEATDGYLYLVCEQSYLKYWRGIVARTITGYCHKHGLKVPNRFTTCQPAGTKSLLTGASPGWHPPKAQRYIRRVTFRRDDPVALACLDLGYRIVPGQSDKDENGRLLDAPFDPRCTEWLVELPIEVPWVNLPGCDGFETDKFAALTLFDFFMQVQTHWTGHNTSGTITLRESEIEAVGDRLYRAIQDDDGYVSITFMAALDNLQTFPRLPFEPITKEQYEAEMFGVKTRRKTSDFYAALAKHDAGSTLLETEAGPAGCDSDKCLLPEAR